MQQMNVKDRLLNATIDLLVQSGDASKITARQIAGKANANLAMINYYFSSKDALVSRAVNKLVADRAIALEKIRKQQIPAKEKLVEFLVKISDIAVDYAQYTKPTIPYTLLEKEIEEPYYILPMVKECLEDTHCETECRVIAYQLTSFFQIVFYRADDFEKYAGLNIMNKEEREKIIHMVVDKFICETVEEEVQK